MLENRIYIKSVAISEKDLNYLRKLKLEKFYRRSLAGILSIIIEEYKLNN